MGHIGHIGITCYEESGQRDFGLRRIRRANLRGDVNAHTLIMRCMYMRERWETLWRLSNPYFVITILMRRNVASYTSSELALGEYVKIPRWTMIIGKINYHPLPPRGWNKCYVCAFDQMILIFYSKTRGYILNSKR